MRTQLVVPVHTQCNLNCTHCTSRTSPASDTTDLVQVRREIDAAIHGDQVVLTGGEPLLHPEILALVRRARTRGATRITIETNALVLARPGVATALRAAGATAVRANVPSLDARTYAAVTQREGVLAIALRGLHAAYAAGLGVGLRIVVVPDNVDGLAAMAEGVGSVLPRVTEAVFELPDLGVTEAGVSRGGLFVAYDRLGPALVGAARAFGERGVAVRFAHGAAVPACAIHDSTEAPVLFTLRKGQRPGEHPLTMRTSHCDACAASNACAGFRVDHARMGAVPAVERLKKRSLAVLRDAGETTRRDDLLFVDVHEAPDEKRVHVRVNYHCNQACGFCYIDRTLPARTRETVLAAIERTARDDRRHAGSRRVVMVFSGGEPTLNPHLGEYIAVAHSHGATTRLQTNAVRLDDDAVAGPLFASGLDEAFVSVHGASADTGDAVTGAPGTWVRTLAGIDRLVRGKIRVELNFVMARANVHEIVPFAELVVRRWGSSVAVMLSLAIASGETKGLAHEFTPRMTDLAVPLAAALDVLRAAGVTVAWSTAGSGCAVPPCTLRDRAYLDVPWERAARTGADPEYVRGEPCATCSLSHVCPGVREEYAAAFGTGELRAFT